MEYKDFRVKYSAEELYKYEKSYILRKYFSLYKGIPGVLILGAFAYFVFIAIQQGIQNVSKFALIIFGILFLAFIVVLFRVLTLTLTYKSRYAGQEMLDKETRIVLSKSGEYPDDLGDTPVYEEASDFYETDDLFIIEVGEEKSKRVLIVPERCCKDDKEQEFVRICAKRMIGNAKNKK